MSCYVMMLLGYRGKPLEKVDRVWLFVGISANPLIELVNQENKMLSEYV